MTGVAALWFALTLVAAVTDWFAVATGRRKVEYLAKPATMALLIVATAAVTPVDPAARGWFVGALALGLAGDVFLMLPNQERSFLYGLVSFLFGHLCYVVGLILGGVATQGLLVGLFVVVLSVATLGRHIVSGVQRARPELVVPVAAYVGVISLMVIVAFGRMNAFAVFGAMLFYASDALIAFDRFLDSRSWMRVAIIVTYHLGQLLLVLSLVW